jgi:hypothetical protein
LLTGFRGQKLSWRSFPHQGTVNGNSFLEEGDLRCHRRELGRYGHEIRGRCFQRQLGDAVVITDGILLGLTPEACERQLRIIRPILPDSVDRLEVQRLQVGHARVNLRFERLSEGVAVKVLKVEEALDVIIEPETSMTSTPETGKV